LDRHREKILEAYRNFRNIDGFAKVVTLEEIRANRSRLTITDYVRPTASKPREKDLPGLMEEWESMSDDVNRSLDALYSLLREGDLHD
jgi:type I restriction enzyme M protein